ncbi:MAG: glutamine synthetase adenylyltransferase [Planctomycetota bacterium]|nr:glutamine synthetase adenylyltransferase [Planctomycetaceae bacterium]MDQ3331068.1 glutamine synthetase adenylyltransferase [Planctomycetota bacterium]
MFQHAPKLLRPGELTEEEAGAMLAAVGFADRQRARQRIESLCDDESCQRALNSCLPMLLAALSETATPDGSLVNFERYVQSVDDRAALFEYLASHPRAVEILVKLFVGSQFLTEILLRNPDYLERLTLHKRLAEFKYREQFFFEACGAAAGAGDLPAQFDALRRYQKWELLRIGACDSFGLLDLKNVTVQLSLLADSLVQACLAILCEKLKLKADGFCVLAFGKLGGEELNYSSDIDLVFLADGDATRYWELGQKLIKTLIDATTEGFLYRVDMRLRPWGKSGALVNTVDSHIGYLKKHGMAWEKQALLKARPIAGDAAVGRDFLKRAEPLIFGMPADEVRASVRSTKKKIEAELGRKGRTWGEVKGGPGSIRDIEFVTQYLQLVYGGQHKAVRSVGTLDGLVRLADFGFIHADEFRHLSNGYNFLRTIEHSLQLMHHKQVHSLPTDRRELAYLARRLDYPDGVQFVAQYERTVQTVRAIYNKYVGEDADMRPSEEVAETGLPEHLARMEPSYQETYSAEDIANHATMLRRLSPDNEVEVEAVRLPTAKNGAKSADASLRWQLTIAGRDHVGDLSMICGLLFVYGFDIVEGNVFTELPGGRKGRSGRGTEFVNVFTVRATGKARDEDWPRYERELEELIKLVADGKHREAHGRLAKRVAAAMRVERPEARVQKTEARPLLDARLSALDTTLLPVEVEVDNDRSELFTVLNIRAEDTIGFLYELTNALSLTGFDINRVVISTTGNRVFDTLYVTDSNGAKVTNPDAQKELRTAVVLIKHFTHLLPKSPNPEAALLHFRDFLTQLFRQENWVEQVASLERSDVLDALAKLLGVSDFLWEDFLRLQYENLFPVVTDIEALAERTPRTTLEVSLSAELESASDYDSRRERLNAFKDREMFRVDMRHILGYVSEFGEFSEELTDVAETVVNAAVEICRRELRPRYGEPETEDGGPMPLSINALGKCGGRELGYASDIELMFVYAGEGRTAGPEVVRTSEYFTRLIELLTNTIAARQEGIFQVDLRLRPYGRAGSLAVAVEAFETYFGPQGAAWPYERQALVKLRPIGGDSKFGRSLVELRDRLIYNGEPFDAVAMRAMREKQVRQLVLPGTFNAKLSPGGLVDTEYLVQGLQITYGAAEPSLRETNTFAAMAALDRAGLLDGEHERLRAAYIFQRQLIDALRMVRGHAKDLTVPPTESEEFEYLARRLGYGGETSRLTDDIQRHTAAVLELLRLLPSEEKK